MYPCILPFLDILISRVNNQIETDIYFQIIESKYYRSFNSFHPKLTRMNAPFNPAKRIDSIISDKDVHAIGLHGLKDT